MRRRSWLGAALVVAAFALTGTACSTEASPVLTPAPSAAAGGSQSGAPSPGTAVTAQSTPGVPIAVLAVPGTLGEPVVVRAADARDSEVDRDHRAVHRVAGQGAVPGPRLLTLLDDGAMFAAQLDAAIPDTVVDLSDVSASVGVVRAQGWSPLDSTLVPLDGANPDGLYFEPQDASVRGDVVVWREGSAGMVGALPDLVYDDWRLIAWHRGSGEQVEVAAASILNGTRQTPTASWDVAPTSDGSSVYFDSQVRDGSGWMNAVIAADLAVPGTVRVVGEGRFPAASGSGGVYYVRHATDGGEQASPTQSDVVLAGPGTTEPSPVITLDGGGSFVVTHLVASDQLVAVTMTDVATRAAGDRSARAWIVVLDTSDGSVAAWIDSGSDDAVVSISADTLVWGNGSGGGDASMYRWQLGDAVPVRLGAFPGMSRPAVNGPFVALPLQGQAPAGSSGGVEWHVLEWLAP